MVSRVELGEIFFLYRDFGVSLLIVSPRGAAYSSSCTCCCYQKGKLTQLGSLGRWVCGGGKRKLRKSETIGQRVLCFSLYGSAEAMAVSRCPRTVRTEVRSGASPVCGLWWKKWQRDSFFFPPDCFGFRLSVSFHQCYLFTYIHMLVFPEGQTG